MHIPVLPSSAHARLYPGTQAAPLLQRLYVKSNNDFLGHIKRALKAAHFLGSSKNPIRFLDIGCGAGLHMDFLSHELGWSTQGLEPSDYGAIGKKVFNLDIRPEFLKKNETGRHFDIVHSSEVIEHTENPLEFLKLLASHLTPKGVLVLTTPDAHKINNKTPRGTLIALLSPGAHTCLFSAQALKLLLNQAGFPYTDIDSLAHSHVVLARRIPLARLPLKSDNTQSKIRRYLEKRLDTLPETEPVRQGYRLKLYEDFINHGLYAEASRIYGPDSDYGKPLLATPEDAAKIQGLKTQEAFSAHFPFSGSNMTYSDAMFLLNYKKDLQGAAQFFDLAHVLALKQYSLIPDASPQEGALLWHALFHQALALSYASKKEEALAIIEKMKILAQKKPELPKTPEECLHRTRKLEDLLIQKEIPRNYFKKENLARCPLQPSALKNFIIRRPFLLHMARKAHKILKSA